MLQDMAELPPIDQHLEKEHQEKTKVKNIQCVEMGKYEVSTAVHLRLKCSEASCLIRDMSFGSCVSPGLTTYTYFVLHMLDPYIFHDHDR